MTGHVCCRCRQPVGEDRVLVGLPLAVSGAGGPAFHACLPYAHILASSPLSPDWISEEIERTRARLANGDDSP